MSSIKDLGHRIGLEGNISDSVEPLIKKTQEKGWSDVTIQGDLELRRSFWINAQLAGVAVNGYSPTTQDQKRLAELRKLGLTREITHMRASDIVKDYQQRVIPELEREMKRHIRSSKSSVKRFNKDITDRNARLNSALNRARESLDDFESLGHRIVDVHFNFEDKAHRYVLADKSRQRELQRERVRRRKF